MENIDESTRKPRRTQGTPSYYYRNRVAYAVIALGAASYFAWTYTSLYKRLKEEIATNFSSPSEEYLDRRGMFAFGIPQTSKDIRKAIDESEKLLSER